MFKLKTIQLLGMIVVFLSIGLRVDLWGEEFSSTRGQSSIFSSGFRNFKPQTWFSLSNETFAYAASNENNKGQSFETRLKGGVDLSVEKNAYTAELQGEVWGMVPLENDVWGHISKANVGYQVRSRADYFFKLGRILPDWGSFHHYSPTKTLFPQFYLDPFETKTDGVVGGYVRIEESLVDLEVLLSPLFIPSLGGPKFDYDQSGKFYSPSRWLLPFYYQATVGAAPTPLQYTLHYPKNLSDILLRPSGAVRLSLRDFFDGYKISATVMHGPDPLPRIRIEGRLDILKEKTLKGNVHLFPEFYNHTAYGFEFRAKRHNFDFYFESVYRVPENEEKMEPYMVKAQEWSHLIAIQSKHANRYLPQTLFGIATTHQFNPYIDPYFKLPSPSLHNFFNRLEWQLNPKVAATQTSEWSMNFDQGIFRQGVHLKMTPKFQLSSGVDLIMGTDETYWGYFRQHDRLWLKGTYAF